MLQLSYLLAITAALLPGWAGPQRDEQPTISREPTRAVPVVRVCSGGDLRAGVPLPPWGVLSTRSNEHDCSIAIVDGTLARAYLMAFREPGVAPPEFNILFSAYPFALNAPFHTFSGGRDAEVVLAGFRFADQPSPVEVLRTPAEVVRASVESELGDEVVVRVPTGRYTGFVGGPAGEYRAGSFSVWGIITDQLEERESGQHSYLCVRKLPSEMVNRPTPRAWRAPPLAAMLARIEQLWLSTYEPAVSSPRISVPPVPVLHIDSGLGFGSGFAVTEELLVSAAHVTVGSEVLAVDGVPARVIAQGDGRPRRAGDWIIARTSSRLATPLPLDTREELPAGQRVILGGLPGPVDWSAPGAFLEKTPVFVEGVVRKSHPQLGAPVAQIDVPVADYHGASGGPVITVGDDGQLRIWGLLTGIAWPIWPVDLMLGYTGLLVTPIPRELREYAPSAYDSSPTRTSPDPEPPGREVTHP